MNIRIIFSIIILISAVYYFVSPLNKISTEIQAHCPAWHCAPACGDTGSECASGSQRYDPEYCHWEDCGGGGGTCYQSDPFTNNYITGSCTVTITHLGWDNNDGSIGGYKDLGSSRRIGMNDSDLSCKGNTNLDFTNNWGASSGRNFSLTTTINGKDAGNSLGAGWQLNASGCTIDNCSSVLVGPSQRVTNSGSSTYTATLYYCGDGVCSCTENYSNCLADCPAPTPTPTPTPTPIPVKPWIQTTGGDVHTQSGINITQ